MTQRDMAGFLDIDVKTIRNWRKNKPHLYEIIIKGFAFDEIVESSKESYEKALSIKEKFELKDKLK
ncbi:MAG: hypothetical protein WC279_03905 [Sulfurimonas sp.]|jgi:hypothetical protein|uniref:hypothetical protein n=1 Tax=unclassified Sulfurimonas TaxID=2623549 RepID=UPI0008AD7C7F|nr:MULTISPECIES: hypothetical protein [unclassified Sulfurimonas]OHE11569.1 MAG: hypothetical protein A2525_09020 [Sulfurimonas sp. RIFOXYD12_FULL_36_11]MBS4068546.1 hypothetical protein [Sulfurimonas sp.]MDD3854983.1 hypothetical protein [Sulfurimonas sp.]MDX9757509.1 hypothetical protein [Sulfurimonas sp.]OHE03791.1 MAG: hypothetical protein A2345_04560 [Sulfurimonas sp. RIFOXYB12_FULL_35_9]